MRSTTLAILLLTFTMIISSPSQASGFYKLSPTYLLPELDRLSDFLQKDSSSEELFRDFSSQINDLAVHMDRTNLELLIKVQFYRIFLNHAQSLKEKYPEQMAQSQKNLLKAKLKELSENQFNSWFIQSLLSDYDNLGSKTRSYITPWLKAFLVMSESEWRNEINKISVIYFQKLLFHLNILNKYSLSKNNATSRVFIYEETLESQVKSKSQSIDEINKKLPKSL